MKLLKPKAYLPLPLRRPLATLVATSTAVGGAVFTAVSSAMLSATPIYGAALTLSEIWALPAFAAASTAACSIPVTYAALTALSTKNVCTRFLPAYFVQDLEQVTPAVRQNTEFFTPALRSKGLSTSTTVYEAIYDGVLALNSMHKDLDSITVDLDTIRRSSLPPATDRVESLKTLQYELDTACKDLHQNLTALITEAKLSMHLDKALPSKNHALAITKVTESAQHLTALNAAKAQLIQSSQLLDLNQ